MLNDGIYDQAKFVSILKDANLKITTPRLKILSFISRLEEPHFTVDQIFKQLLAENLEASIATIYRVLNQFEEAGIVEKHSFEGDRAVFELKPSLHHDHLVCIICGKVVKFHDEMIEKRQHKIASENGFELKDHSLYLYGICSKKECRSHKN